MRAFDQAIQDLLAAWRQHQDLRSMGASVPELYQSRVRLDTVRSQVAQLRIDL